MSLVERSTSDSRYFLCIVGVVGGGMAGSTIGR